MKKATLQLETLTCPSCAQKIEKAVKGLDGVDKDTLSVLFNASKVKVNYDDAKVSAQDIGKRITDLGYEVRQVLVKDA